MENFYFRNLSMEMRHLIKNVVVLCSAGALQSTRHRQKVAEMRRDVVKIKLVKLVLMK